MQAHVLTTLLFLGAVTATGAVFSDVETQGRVLVHVQGLDESSAPTIERALRALESEGEPPHRKVLAEVAVDVEQGVITLDIAAGQTLRLKQLERSFNATGVRLRSDSLVLGESVLWFDGDVPEDALEKLKRALTNDLFATAEVRLEGEPQRLVARVKPGDKQVTLDSAQKAAQTVVPGLRLADATWSHRKGT
jgi:NADPH-dependent ferric siderophore reductase